MIIELIEKLANYSEYLAEFLEARVNTYKSFKKIYNSLSKEDKERLITKILPKHYKKNNHGSYFNTDDYKKILDWVVNGKDRKDVSVEPSGDGKHRIIMVFNGPVGTYSRLHVKSIRLLKELYDASKIANHRDVSLSSIKDILDSYEEGKDYLIVREPAYHIAIEFGGTNLTGHIKSIFPTLDTRRVDKFGKIPSHILRRSDLPDALKHNSVLNLKD